MPKRKSAKQNEVDIDLAGTATANARDTELGQIRDLLFGQQAEETLQRVNRVEREIMSALNELAASVDAKFTEVDERFAAEVDARIAADSELQGRIDNESDVVKNAQIDLRSTIDRKSADICEQLGAARSELQGQIETVDADLREKNVDRESLAGLFEQVAEQLNGSDS